MTVDGLSVIDAMLAGVDEFALAELERALTLKLGNVATPADRRVAELGVLAQMLRVIDPELQLDPPPLRRADYDSQRHEYDEQAPTAATLAEKYGGWRAAKRAAHGLFADGRYAGTSCPWRASVVGARMPPYTLEQVHASIRRCAIELGRIPSSGDYHWWSREKRRKLRAAGIDLTTSTNPEHRIPGIAPIYRLYPDGPKRRKFQQALSDAHVNAAEVAAARAQRLVRGLGIVTTDQPLDAFLELAAAALQDAGINEDVRTLVQTYGLGALSLTQASLVARSINCSLDWLAGCSIERGNPPTGTQLDIGSIETRREQAGITSTTLREQLNLAPGPYRRLINRREEPTLAELVVISRAIHTEPAQLLYQPDPLWGRTRS